MSYMGKYNHGHMWLCPQKKISLTMLIHFRLLFSGFLGFLRSEFTSFNFLVRQNNLGVCFQSLLLISTCYYTFNWSWWITWSVVIGLRIIIIIIYIIPSTYFIYVKCTFSLRYNQWVFLHWILSYFSSYSRWQ